jgi:single-stranded DNA-binding protein
VGLNPALRETNSGTQVTLLSVATNHNMGSGTESERERTDRHQLTLWSKLALFAQEFV